jgi:hypothetical protein
MARIQQQLFQGYQFFSSGFYKDLFSVTDMKEVWKQKAKKTYPKKNLMSSILCLLSADMLCGYETDFQQILDQN